MVLDNPSQCATVIDLCPTCVGYTSTIYVKQTPPKMIFSPAIGHRVQIDQIDMSSCETEDGFKWIARYCDHHNRKCNVEAARDKTAAKIDPTVIRIMASTIVPILLQSDDGGDIHEETIKAVNRYFCD